MNNDEKILKALEALQADVKDVKQGQTRLEKTATALQTDVATIKTEHGKQLERIEKHQEHHDKILGMIAPNLETVLREQQQQRTDIRSFHDDLHRVEEK